MYARAWWAWAISFAGTQLLYLAVPLVAYEKTGSATILASIITLVHLSQPAHTANDDSVAAYAIIGYTTFITFRNTFNRADGAIEANQPLLYHRMVTVFDIIVAGAGSAGWHATGRGQGC